MIQSSPHQTHLWRYMETCPGFDPGSITRRLRFVAITVLLVQTDHSLFVSDKGIPNPNTRTIRGGGSAPPGTFPLVHGRAARGLRVRLPSVLQSTPGLLDSSDPRAVHEASG